MKPKSQRPSVDDTSTRSVSSPKPATSKPLTKEGPSRKSAHEPPPAKKRKRSQSDDDTSDEDFDASKLDDGADDGTSDDGSASDDWRPSEIVPVAKPSLKIKKESSKKVSSVHLYVVPTIAQP